MDNTISLICKNCGGHLSYKNNCSLICDSCGTVFAIEEPCNNFVVIAGTLKEYKGASTTVIIPDHVLTIGEGAFKNSINLKNVILPLNVTRIENSAFENCENLYFIDIPKSVQYIGDSAFKSSGLVTLNIEGELKYIGHDAFMYCYNLREITISNSFEKFGLRVFKQCNSLQTINMNLHLFAGSLKPSIEARKNGDTRPTFFDFFHGTPFFNKLYSIHRSKKCFYCNGDLDSHGVCSLCGEKDYDVAGCFVATAVYGSYDCPQVWTLRRYRDNTLAKTWYGRAFIRTYYAVSPTLVKLFGHTEWFKKMWKGKLDHMVSDLQAKGVESTPYEDRSW